MSFIFTTTQPMNEREKLIRRATSARVNIVFLICLTVVNIALLFFDSNTYFLFSASVPFYLIEFAAFFTGSLPASAYYEPMDSYNFYPRGFLWLAIAVAVIIIALYAVCFFSIASKKKDENGDEVTTFSTAWIVTATVLFAIDSLAYIGLLLSTSEFGTSSIIDLLIHIYVIATFIMGAISAAKLKKLPAVPTENETDVPAEENEHEKG